MASLTAGMADSVPKFALVGKMVAPSTTVARLLLVLRGRMRARLLASPSLVLRNELHSCRYGCSANAGNGLSVGLCRFHGFSSLTGFGEGKVLHGQQLLAESGAAHSTNQAISQGLFEKLFTCEVTVNGKLAKSCQILGNGLSWLLSSLAESVSLADRIRLRLEMLLQRLDQCLERRFVQSSWGE